MSEANNAGLPELEYKGYVLVRDAAGFPVVDDLKAMPLDTWQNFLNDDEREYLLDIHGVENIPTGD